MTSTGVNETLNKYFDILGVSSGTIEVNKLHSMCLMPLFNNLLGGTMKDYAMKDKCFWTKFMEKCFPNLAFSKDESSCSDVNLYVGTANVAPDSETILEYSTKYDLSKSTTITSPRVMGTYFWIAVPSGRALDRVDNTDFAGDLIPASGFKMSEMTINNGQYNVYWLKSIIPFKSTYQVILK